MPLPVPVQGYGFVRVSPDGKRLVVTITDGLANNDLFVYDVAGETVTQVTNDDNSLAAIWTADGRSLLYARRENRLQNLYIQDIDASGRASGPARRLTDSTEPGR